MIDILATKYIYTDEVKEDSRYLTEGQNGQLKWKVSEFRNIEEKVKGK